MLVGAFIGFAVSYKYPLDDASQSLLTLTLRLFAMLLILAGTNNYLASLTIIVLIITWRLWFRLFSCLFCGLCQGDSEEDTSTSSSDDQFVREDGNNTFDNSYSGNSVPLRRLTRKKYLSQRMDPKRLAHFHVTGADEYITPKQYQEETESYTELELAKLSAELRHSNGDWVSKLSVSGQQRMKSWLASDDIGSDTD